MEGIKMSLVEHFYDENSDGDPIGLERAYEVLCLAGYNPIIEELKGKIKREGEKITLAKLQELAGSLGDPKHTMERALAVLDKNGNGTIELDKLKSILKSGYFSNSGTGDDNGIIEFFTSADTNGDGHLDIEELTRMICEGQVSRKQ
ncbi:hypothetical protein MAR_000639 [Mya arenaria]|uniref:EF-hand domain-containing protein n=1 Tax=Mya arenaria TaxID=6604 RepID=A0ABY7FDE8_MYAAR|nr:uncharacterized protein LOC128209408 [Mya arenaria]WAR18801.1 hypothetical protein MAR_000639 [Mya arenaria]